jgi:hypothetical protein
MTSGSGVRRGVPAFLEDHVLGLVKTTTLAALRYLHGLSPGVLGGWKE